MSDKIATLYVDFPNLTLQMRFIIVVLQEQKTKIRPSRQQVNITLNANFRQPFNFIFTLWSASRIL